MGCSYRKVFKRQFEAGNKIKNSDNFSTYVTIKTRLTLKNHGVDILNMPFKIS